MAQVPTSAEAIAFPEEAEELDPDEHEARAAASTRERILNVALDLFTEKGFDGASLREIAEQLGVTKAAIYYHFASKDDILMARHAPPRVRQGCPRQDNGSTCHPSRAVGRPARPDRRPDAGPTQAVPLPRAESGCARKAPPQGPRRRARRHPGQVPSGARRSPVPLRDRVRMACSFGAVFVGLFMSGDAFEGTSNQALGDLLRDAVHDVLAG